MKTVLAAWLRRGVAGLALVATPAVAAPYCINIQGITEQCLYFDANECRIQAQRAGGSCDVNPTEVTLPSAGTYPYCVVGAGYSACKFVDRGSCDAEARRLKANCVQSFTASASAPPDPYRDLFVTGR